MNIVQEWKRVKDCKRQDKHCLTLQKWHWTHGKSGNEYAFVRALYQCQNCQKTSIVHFHGQRAKTFADLLGSEKYEHF